MVRRNKRLKKVIKNTKMMMGIEGVVKKERG